MNDAAPFTTERYEPRRELLLSAWLSRKLPPRDYLLGNVLCSTSRWLLWGDTGIGKTLFALALGAAVSAGRPFLNWEGRRPARVMYLDGEMPAETFKERMALVAQLYGDDLTLYGYNRDVLKDGEMPPLNTPDGEKWLWNEIDLIKPDLIEFDSIMCLLAGAMSEEESWTPVKALLRAISSRRIAQIWLHHTGHDTTKGFGTKTREWEMDTVIALGEAVDDAVSMEFKKARLRNPETREQFKRLTIECTEAGWSVSGAGAAKPAARQGELGMMRDAVLHAYDRLADAVETTSGLGGERVRKVSVEKLRDELKSRGFFETNDTGGVTPAARKQFQRAKAVLISGLKPALVEHEGQIWRSPSLS
jgi:hypothetical protein